MNWNQGIKLSCVMTGIVLLVGASMPSTLFAGKGHGSSEGSSEEISLSPKKERNAKKDKKTPHSRGRPKDRGTESSTVDSEDVPESLMETASQVISHFFSFGHNPAEGNTIEHFFDETYYREYYGSQLGFFESGLHHYQHEGWKKGYKPNTWFDPVLFQQHYGSLIPEGTDPFQAFLNTPRGVTEKPYRGERVVVSATSHPPRIDSAWLSLFSLLTQTQKPNQVILYLAQEDFPAQRLPDSLKALGSLGLEVKFSKQNYKVATKLLPALQEFPDDLIVTVDDDRVYDAGLLEVLTRAHRHHKKDIISPIARRYVFDYGSGREEDLPSSGRDPYGPPLPVDENGVVHARPHVYPHMDYLKRSLLFNTKAYGIFEGFAGVLYPPRALDAEVLNFDAFRLLTPFADDVWFQVMAIKAGTKVRGLSEDVSKKLEWPLEIEGTQESGLFHQHLRANDWMLYRALSYYGLLKTVGAPLIENPACPNCKRDVFLPTPQDKRSVGGHGKNRCDTCLNDADRKVLAIGAYDYGNIGDGSYRRVLQETLGHAVELRTIPDTVRLDEEGHYIGMKDNRKDYPFDALVIGGGGILKNWHSDVSHLYYLEKALEKDKPVFVISVGLQTSKNELTVQETGALLGNMGDLLRQVRLLSVRSAEDYRLLMGALGEDMRGRLVINPDLGYLTPEILDIRPSGRKKYITLIQTGSANVNNEDVRRKIADLQSEYSGSKLAIMNWGGISNPHQVKDCPEYDLFDKESREAYPDAKVYMGDGYGPELKSFRYAKQKTRESDLSLEKALYIVSKSHFVITGRYHGLVFAKALGVPYWAPIGTHKVMAEEAAPLDMKMSRRPLDMILYNLHKGRQDLKDPGTWSDDDRNTAIVQAHQTHDAYGIKTLQGMSNGAIYSLLVFGPPQSY